MKDWQGWYVVSVCTLFVLLYGQMWVREHRKQAESEVVHRIRGSMRRQQ